MGDCMQVLTESPCYKKLCCDKRPKISYKQFIPSYERCSEETKMGKLLGFDYQRRWFCERNVWMCKVYGQCQGGICCSNPGKPCCGSSAPAPCATSNCCPPCCPPPEVACPPPPSVSCPTPCPVPLVIRVCPTVENSCPPTKCCNKRQAAGGADRPSWNNSTRVGRQCGKPHC